MTVKTDDKGGIFSQVRQKWLVETPEECVRKTYLPVLVNECGFVLEQIAEQESVTGRGALSHPFEWRWHSLLGALPAFPWLLCTGSSKSSIRFQ